MSIIKVPKELHISSIEELMELKGECLWRVGQGGVSALTQPEPMGRFLAVKDRFMFFAGDRRSSLLDHNVSELNGYNNWFLCVREYQAENLYWFLRGVESQTSTPFRTFGRRPLW